MLTISLVAILLRKLLYHQAKYRKNMMVMIFCKMLIFFRIQTTHVVILLRKLLYHNVKYRKSIYVTIFYQHTMKIFAIILKQI